MDDKKKKNKTTENKIKFYPIIMEYIKALMKIDADTRQKNMFIEDQVILAVLTMMLQDTYFDKDMPALLNTLMKSLSSGKP
jgi:hypothetical protein